jgi:hypothetical protein
MVDTSKIMTAFTIKVKRPRVIILIGSVKRRSTGLITTFKIPRISATISALKKPFIVIPGSNDAVARTAIVTTSQCIKILIFKILYSKFLKIILKD